MEILGVGGDIRIWLSGLLSFTIKALSKEMDHAKSGFIQKVSVKERGAEIFSIFRPPLIL
jgi:hypothetical protein